MSTAPVAYNNPSTQPVTQQYQNKNDKGYVTPDQTTDPKSQKHNHIINLLFLYASIAIMFCIPLGCVSLFITHFASQSYQAGSVKKAVRLGITSCVLSTISIGISVTLILVVIVFRIVYTV